MTNTTILLLLAAFVTGFGARKLYRHFFFHRSWRPQPPARRLSLKERRKRKLLGSLTLGTGQEGMFH